MGLVEITFSLVFHEQTQGCLGEVHINDILKQYKKGHATGTALLGSLGFTLPEVIYSSVLSCYANSLFVPISECAMFPCWAERLPYAERVR